VVRLAVVGDVHDQWQPEDALALSHLGVDLVLFVGDFGNESLEVVRQVAALPWPKAVVLGNHDAWYTATEVIDYFVPNLADLFNRTRIYLYDSAEYWAVQGVSEGFGLQPLEAMACGCRVFSSVNGGLADYLDPGFNCEQIGCYHSGYDIAKILRALDAPNPPISSELFQEYRAPQVQKKLRNIWQAWDEFFDYQRQHPADMAPLTRWHLWSQRLRRWGQRGINYCTELLKKSP